MTVAVASKDRGAAAGSIAVLWACALPVALLGSWTCFAALPGVNWTLWTLAASAGLLIARRGAPLALRARAALALGCTLSGAAAITADPRTDALVFLGVAELCGFALLSVLTPAEPLGPTALIRLPLTLGRAVGREAAARLTQTLAVLRIQSSAPVLRGAALAGGLGVVLLLLLSAADPTLAAWRNGAWTFLHTLHFLTHSAFFAALALILLGAYGIAARSGPHEQTPGTTATPPAGRATLSDIERLMVLGTALGSFVLFFTVGFATRLGLLGAARLPAGETLAQATHRGFGEMLVAAALCATTLILLDRHALRGRGEPRVLRLSAAVIVASLVLVLSAYRRVSFYEAAFGYTQLRVDVQIGCAAVSAALLLLGWRLRLAMVLGGRIDLARLAHHIGLTAIACVAVLACWNSAGWIVSANVTRYQRTGKLDVGYLGHLAVSSPDAIAALVEHLPDLAPAEAGQVRAALRRTGLTRAQRAGPGGRLAWYEWSVRREAALSALRAPGLLGPARH